MDKEKVKSVIYLQGIFLFYSVIGIISKTASVYDFFTFEFVFLYACEILFLGIYMVIWQQIIKRTTLGFAYSNKAIVILWSLLWAFLLFGEEIKINNIIGAVIIIIGILIVVGDSK